MNIPIVVNASVRMLLFCAVVWIIIRVVRLRNPHGELLVWRLALIASLALPALLFFRVAPSFVTPLQLPVLMANGAGPPNTPSSGSLHGLPWRLFVAIYMSGALLLLARLAMGLIGLWRITRAAAPLPIMDGVRTSRHVQSPATFGGTVLLPVESCAWPAGKLDAILAHELAHVRSRDCYWSWLAQLNCALFWFSPHAWWLRRRLELLAETTSDDAVVAARHDPVTYAELLLDFARRPNNRSVAMSVAESNVSKRIERLLARIPPAKALPRATRWAALAFLAPVVMLVASTTRAAPEPVSIYHSGVVLYDAVNPDDFYPAVAIQENVEGWVVVKVDVDALGQLVDVRVVKAEPADPRFGFGDAAMEVARKTKYSNPSQQPSSITFAVKFALADK